MDKQHDLPPTEETASAVGTSILGRVAIAAAIVLGIGILVAVVLWRA
jgi:hypothetical protein